MTEQDNGWKFSVEAIFLIRVGEHGVCSVYARGKDGTEDVVDFSDDQIPSQAFVTPWLYQLETFQDQEDAPKIHSIVRNS